MEIIRGKAADVLQAATELNTLATLYVFAKKAEQFEQGFAVSLEIPGIKFYLNSNLLKEVIQQQLEVLGARLEGSGIDLQEYVAGLDQLMATSQTGG